MMPILVKGDDVRSGANTKAPHGCLRVARESVGENQLFHFGNGIMNAT